MWLPPFARGAQKSNWLSDKVGDGNLQEDAGGGECQQEERRGKRVNSEGEQSAGAPPFTFWSQLAHF